jgi:hypothetical protein
MTYADINKMFTAEVSKYLARGYHFNTASMSGSQGETAKVDLTNGTEIIRVLLRTFSEGWDKQGTELFVGRVTEKENVRRDVAYCVNTIWNNRLEPVSSQRFYEVNGYGDSNKFYGTEADAEAVSKVRMRRYAQCPSRQNKDMTNAQTIKIAVPFIRRKLGIKNVDKKRIEVFRTPDHRYIISYRGTGYQLNRKED